MKILWFLYKPLDDKKYKGGNWIKVLVKNINHISDIDLAICYHGENDYFFKKIDNITHYNIKQKSSFLKKWYNKLTHKLTDEEIEEYLNVIENFKPDIIQIFGTEFGFGKICKHTNVPIIIHVQGLVNPYLNAWFPQKINLFKTLLFTKPIDIIKGNGFFHQYLRFKKKANREIKIIKCNNNYFTRTHWDTSYIRLLNPDANIFNCNEMLREEFKQQEWKFKNKSEKRIVSVINGEIYKGWDNLLRIASGLKQYTNLNFKWIIIGINQHDYSAKLFEHTYKTKFKENNVFFAGKMNAKQIVEEFLQADLFIHPSHIDNSPNSVCEAMATGIPVVSTNVGGISSLIKNFTEGILLPDNDIYLWIAKIYNLLNSPEELIKYSKNARQKALKRHDNKEISKCIIESYKKVINNTTQKTPDKIKTS